MKIEQTIKEQRQIIDHLKRYEDMIYSLIARRLAILNREIAAIFQLLPIQPAAIDIRIPERRRKHLPVAIVRRRGTDRNS